MLQFGICLGYNSKSPCKIKIFCDEARHGKAFEGLLKRYFG